MVSIELLPELIPGLPEEIGRKCLTRFHYSTHRLAARVCRRWRELLQSREFYYHRKNTGCTQKAECLVQLLKSDSDPGGPKAVGPPRYGITVLEPVSGTWDRVDPVPKYPGGLPLLCQITSSEGKTVVMGGWDPTTYDPVRDVFIYEFTTQRWSQGKQMPDTRSFFAACELDRRIIVAGGHDENKNALSTAWENDVSRDEWTELSRMSQERDECQAIVIGSEFWAVSGNRTDNQGGFEGSAELMDLGQVNGSALRRLGRLASVLGHVWELGKTRNSPAGLIVIRRYELEYAPSNWENGHLCLDRHTRVVHKGSFWWMNKGTNLRASTFHSNFLGSYNLAVTWKSKSKVHAIESLSRFPFLVNREFRATSSVISRCAQSPNGTVTPSFELDG